MLKTITHLALAASLLAATSIGTAPVAQAGGGRAAGVVAGTIIGLGVLGAYAATRDGYRDRCYAGHRVCDVVGQHCWWNRYGERVCRDDVRCYRRRICD